MSTLIDKIKTAFFTLQTVSVFTPASVLAVVVKAYIMSLVSYGITVWWPILMAERDQKQIKSLRYWYTACCLMVCYNRRDLMGWSNRTKTLSPGTNTEASIAVLSGVPTLDELYIASCISHHDQILKMVKLGWLNGLVSLSKSTRRTRLVYHGKVLRGRVSPLAQMVRVLNSIRDPDLQRAKNNMKTDGLLRIFELQREELPPGCAREFQKVVTLEVFGKLSTDEGRKRAGQDLVAYAEEHKSLIKRGAKSFKLLLEMRNNDKAAISTAFP